MTDRVDSAAMDAIHVDGVAVGSGSARSLVTPSPPFPGVQIDGAEEPWP